MIAKPGRVPVSAWFACDVLRGRPAPVVASVVSVEDWPLCHITFPGGSMPVDAGRLFDSGDEAFEALERAEGRGV